MRLLLLTIFLVRVLLKKTLLSFFFLTLSLNSFAKPIERIVTLSPHAVEMLYAIGAGDKIVATVEHSDYPEEALKIERIGSYTGVQIERLVELNPDLVITWTSGNQTADLKKIDSLNLNVFKSQPENIADIGNELLALGKITGYEDNAKALVKSINSRYEKVKKNYLNKLPVNVFYQLWYDPFRTLGPNSWISKMIEDCNGRNIFFDAETDYPVVSLESILVKNPEVIIIPDHSSDAKAYHAIWDKWPQVKAVKNNHLYAIEGDILHRFTPRALDGLEQLCEAIDKAR